MNQDIKEKIVISVFAIVLLLAIVFIIHSVFSGIASYESKGDKICEAEHMTVFDYTLPFTREADFICDNNTLRYEIKLEENRYRIVGVQEYEWFNIEDGD